jgi:drug/metabolite transporter (DMT)-like permease
MVVNLIRLVIALVFLSITCWFLRGKLLPTDATAHAWFWLTLSAVAGFLIGDLCLFRSLVLIGPRVAMLIMSLVPPIGALIGWVLLGETLSALDWVAMSLTVGGVAMVVSERKRDENGVRQKLPIAGLLLAFVGALGQATNIVLAKKGITDGYNPFAATQIRVIVGVVGFMIMFTVIGRWSKVVEGLKHKSGMLFTSTGAFFGPFLGVSFSLMAVQYVESGVALTIMAITPVFLIPMVILIHKEKVSLRAVVGAVVAVLGVALLFLP